ncbi:methyltransferase [Sphingomonas naphthae]|uniref:Methyltransferase n=1 Tax=Sphingomonas naphthae TaxID=1813468 RepID=A0ABY7TPZ2_9SPHN|nr:methyltransferase [Sphingomonas naphthae]WCT75307.1 methyltransferase [Sphingomonas naphthae]
MRTPIAALLLAAALPAIAIAASVPAPVTKALAAPAREADKKDDERRKGGEITAFAGVKPGQTVVDLLPGGGYWTRLFSGVVGPKGKVIDVWPAAMVAPGARGEPRMKALIGQPGFENVEALPVDLAAYATPPADVVFTSQNIHDLPNKSFGGLDITAFSKNVLASLKPGGRFIVIDHTGKPGSGMTETDTLHRIEPKVVKDAIVAAGFKFAGESKLLAHAADDHTLKVFDPALRGNTDQFIYAFEKPKK